MHKLFLKSDKLTFSNSRDKDIRSVVVHDLDLLPEFLQGLTLRGRREDINRACEVIDKFIEQLPHNTESLMIISRVLQITLQGERPVVPKPVEKPTVVTKSAADHYRNLQAFFETPKLYLENL